MLVSKIIGYLTIRFVENNEQGMSQTVQGVL